MSRLLRRESAVNALPCGWRGVTALTCSLAVLASGAMAFDFGSLMGGGATDTVDVRPISGWAREGAMGVIPFTRLSVERNVIQNSLPCKWVSRSGTGDDEYGRAGLNSSGRYDFLCKGGNWATVSLMLDAAPGYDDGLGRVRLVWREWPENVNPGGGEAYVAQTFLKLVSERLVPADLAEGVNAAFFGTRSKTWWAGKLLRISYTLDDQRTYKLHRLEITGLGRQLNDVRALKPTMQVAKPVTKDVAVVPAPVAEPAKAVAAPVDEVDLPQPVVTPAVQPVTQAAAPVAQVAPAAVNGPRPAQYLPVQDKPAGAVVDAARAQLGTSVGTPWLQLPGGAGAPPAVVLPGTPVSGSVYIPKAELRVRPAVVPQVEAKPAPAGQPATPPVMQSPVLPQQGMDQTGGLKAAEPVDVRQQADPASLAVPKAPPSISTTLVPNPDDVVGGRAAAPTNFDVYNRAEQLTRDIESKAMTRPNSELKVVPATPVQNSSGLAVPLQNPLAAAAAMREQAAEGTLPVPTPGIVQGGATSPSGAVWAPAVAADKAKAAQQTAQQGVQQAGAGDDQPAGIDPRFDTGNRPLPQLKFIPKAKPVERPDAVIRFEDEKSSL